MIHNPKQERRSYLSPVDYPRGPDLGVLAFRLFGRCPQFDNRHSTLVLTLEGIDNPISP